MRNPISPFRWITEWIMVILAWIFWIGPIIAIAFFLSLSTYGCGHILRSITGEGTPHCKPKCKNKIEICRFEWVECSGVFGGGCSHSENAICKPDPSIPPTVKPCNNENYEALDGQRAPFCKNVHDGKVCDCDLGCAWCK